MSPFRISVAVFMGVAFGFAPFSAFAKDCLQDHAVYEDATHQYQVAFQSPSEASAVSHLFSITIAKSGAKLDGNVQQTEDVVRSLGTALYKCPEGDVTGADIEACTVWQGVIYAVDAKGKIDNLAASSAPAAQQLRFSDFGAAIRLSKVWTEGKASTVPYDAFQFKECRS